MSLYHLHSQIIGRGKGKDATAAAAYRATEKIKDRTTGLTHDYRKKTKALHTEMITPKDCPEWCKDRAEFWNRVEEKESRKNSQFCREYEVALQSELTLEQNLKILREFIKTNFTSCGLVADFAVHAPHKDADGNDNKNTHAHIMVSTRRVNKDGWGDKFRADGLERYKNIQGQKAEKLFLEEVRKSWADLVNAEFERLGMTERIDHRTLQEQGIEREPQQHQGKAATAMERRGEEPDRGKQRHANEKNETEINETEIETAETRAIDAKNQKLEKQRQHEIDPQEKQALGLTETNAEEQGNTKPSPENQELQPTPEQNKEEFDETKLTAEREVTEKSKTEEPRIQEIQDEAKKQKNNKTKRKAERKSNSRVGENTKH